MSGMASVMISCRHMHRLGAEHAEVMIRLVIAPGLPSALYQRQSCVGHNWVCCELKASRVQVGIAPSLRCGHVSPIHQPLMWRYVDRSCYFHYMWSSLWIISCNVDVVLQHSLQHWRCDAKFKLGASTHNLHV